jgi:hypothetical protein
VIHNAVRHVVVVHEWLSLVIRLGGLRCVFRFPRSSWHALSASDVCSLYHRQCRAPRSARRGMFPIVLHGCTLSHVQVALWLANLAFSQTGGLIFVEMGS